MPTELTNYQCPACTGPLRFDGATGKLVCDYCGSSYDVAQIEALYADKNEKAENAFNAKEEKDSTGDGWDTSDLGSGEWGVADGMKQYNCPSCGAELICDENTAATSCPYCGNPTVVPGQFSGMKKPDFVLPFKLSKEDAQKALLEYYKGKKLLPGRFRSASVVKEVKGVYVPFWMYDGTAEADILFEGVKNHIYRSGDYEVTRSDHFDVRRAGTVPFEKVPVNASSKMKDEYMDALEPFDYNELKAFSQAYLPGFLADKYDKEANEIADKADQRVESTAVSVMRETVSGYDSVMIKGKSVRLRRGKVHYALLPVYMLTVKWKDTDYLFAVNGRSAKTVGELPVDKGRFWGYLCGIAAGLTAVITAVVYFLTAL